MRRLPRIVVPLLVALLFAAACGQKPGVARLETGGSASGDFGVGTDGTSTDGGATDGGATDGSTDGGATDGTSTDGGTADGGATDGSTDGGTGTTVAAGPGDRTGITDTEIRIGIHAPVTGAAPIPQSSFEEGRETYWKYAKDALGGVFGRNVRVFFENDNFDPAPAVQKCKKMVEQDKVFVLIGGGGADQITACAKYAQSVGVPYLSAGVNQNEFTSLRAYFALSMTYAQQSPLLVQMVKKKFPGKKIGVAVADSGSFDDAYASIKKAFAAAGFDIVYDDRIPKSANAGEAATISQQMQTSGAEVVYFLSSPTTFITVANSGTPTYKPQFIGPGITSGLNTVATVGCNGKAGVDNAIFLSPFPQLDAIAKLDPNFQKSYNKYNGDDGDDLGLALWGLNKTLHQMFLAAGKDMSRQSFVATIEGGKAFKSGVYPPVTYSARNHFGGSQAHVLQADCGAPSYDGRASGRYKTIHQFVSGF